MCREIGTHRHRASCLKSGDLDEVSHYNLGGHQKNITTAFDGGRPPKYKRSIKSFSFAREVFRWLESST